MPNPEAGKKSGLVEDIYPGLAKAGLTYTKLEGLWDQSLITD